MSGVIALIVAGSLLLAGIAGMCLQYLLVRRGRERFHLRIAIGTFFFIASFLAGLGLLAISVSDRSAYPWAGAAALMVSALGLAVFVISLHQRGQRVGFLAIAVFTFTLGIEYLAVGHDYSLGETLLFLVAAMALMIVGALHQGSVIETKLRQAGRFVASPISFDARLMRISRLLLAIACAAVLVADGTRLLSPNTVWLLIAATWAGILFTSASFVCLCRQYAYPWLT